MLIAAVSLMALAVVACAAAPTGSPTPQGIWKTYFDQALADPNLSDFERQVLSDYQITDAEYQEAKDRFVTCMANKGWIIIYNWDGTYVTQPAPGNTNSAAIVGIPDGFACSKGTTNWIEPIYWGMRDNPQGLTREQQIRTCFQKYAVPDGAGLSDDQFARLVDDVNFHASTPEGVLCYWDPTGANGYSIEQAEAMDSGPRGQASVGPGSEGTPVIVTPT